MLTTIHGTLGFLPLDFHFRYDKQGRLTDYFCNYYGNYGGLIWHRYSYPKKNTIIDSSFDYVGDIRSPIPPDTSFDMYVDELKLDETGRIIKDIALFPTDGPPYAFTDYTYDKYGNLIKPGTPYDDKINPYHTNHVWMFTNKDYSVNNASPMGVTGYNQYGLPLGFSSAYLFNLGISTISIQYACDIGYDDHNK